MSTRGGETALVFIAGVLSHVLRKRAVLRGEGEAPLGEGPLGAAAAMSRTTSSCPPAPTRPSTSSPPPWSPR